MEPRVLALFAMAGWACACAAQAADQSHDALRNAAFAPSNEASPTIRRQQGEAFGASGPTAWRTD
jgi:hypothetical protein